MYKVIDLFAGAGGLSLGFEKKSFDICFAVEKDKWAIDTYKANHKNQNILEADITTIEDEVFEKYKNKVDVVMGGPPCQGFSIAASNRRLDNDKRNILYQHYLRVVRLVQPKIVLIENVKEILKYNSPSGEKIVDDIKLTLENLGYIFDYKILNCGDYGVPQDRKRFFGVGIRKNLFTEELDIEKLFEVYKTNTFTLEDAISDLPRVKPKEYSEDSTMAYCILPQNSFQSSSRQNSQVISNHIPMQHTNKTIEKFEYLLSASDDNLPLNLKSRVRGNVDLVSDKKYAQNHRVLSLSKIAPTITASFYSSFVHPSQPRNLTVREAARIQTFPDTFVFKGKKTTLSKKLLAKKGIVEELHLDQFNQVGNAVPPMMAGHFAEIFYNILVGELL